jgi:eukaryotic-like serine/threonine-protein kinase
MPRESAPLMHTEAGAVMGTVAYMSPEQVPGHQVDHRSSPRAPSSTRCSPEAGLRARDVGRDGLRDPQRRAARQPRPGTSGAGPVVWRCLQKKPEERFQSARHLAFELRKLSRVLAAAQEQPRRFSADQEPQAFPTCFQDCGENVGRNEQG